MTVLSAFIMGFLHNPYPSMEVNTILPKLWRCPVQMTPSSPTTDQPGDLEQHEKRPEKLSCPVLPFEHFTKDSELLRYLRTGQNSEVYEPLMDLFCPKYCLNVVHMVLRYMMERE
jgi:hypothetical protein